jgi:myo-inositol-1(or 4)-monophosphatase
LPDADPPDDDFVRLRAALDAAVRDAGLLTRSMQTADLKSWTKSGSSPVSDADHAANDLIRDRLQAATPDYGWLSEESDDDATRLGKRLTWIVDPIDGTRAFLAGREDWCVSVALVDGDTPVLAAVYAPATDEFFSAVRGHGATRNGIAVRATGGTEFDVSRMAGPKYLVERLMRTSTDIAPHPRIGSLALRLCRVADGSLDLAFAGGHCRDWDIAGADLIVSEAGGKLTLLAGDVIRYNRKDVTHDNLVAAGRDRHHGIVARFRNDPN